MTKDRSHLPAPSLAQNATAALEGVGSLLEQGTAVVSLAISEIEGCEALGAVSDQDSRGSPAFGEVHLRSGRA